MQVPPGYEDAEAKTRGAFQMPEAGPVLMRIVGVEDKLSSKGDPMLVLTLDIADGEFKGFYEKQTAAFGRESYQKYYQLTSGDNLSYFKGLITSIEKSNPGFQWKFEESDLVGKVIIGNLREEEYYSKKNSRVQTYLKVAQILSTESMEDGTAKVLPLRKMKKENIPAPKQDDGWGDSGAPNAFNADDDAPF